MSDSNEVRIEAGADRDRTGAPLVGELETALAAEYPPEQRHGLSRSMRSFNRTSGSSSQDCAARR